MNSKEYLYGQDGNDTIYGGDGNDQLHAQHGDNHLDGGIGLDKYYSGTGSDTFVFTDMSEYLGGTQYERIYNFDETNGDVLDLSATLTGFNPLSDDINDFINFSPTGNNNIMMIDEDGTGTAAVSRSAGVLYGNSTLDDVTDIQTLITNGTIVV